MVYSPLIGVHVLLMQRAGRGPDEPDHDHQDDRAGEQVGGQREDLAGLPDAAQVAVAHQQDDADGDLFAVGTDGGERGGDGRGAGRDLDGHRHHVVDQQGHGGHLRDPRPEVLPGHHVRTAGPGVNHDHLAVGKHHEQHDEQDHAGHRDEHGESGQAEDRHQLDEDLLGAVGRGGDPVRRQHAQGQLLGQPLLAELRVDHRRPQQAALRRVPEGLRELVAPGRPGPGQSPCAPPLGLPLRPGRSIGDHVFRRYPRGPGRRRMRAVRLLRPRVKVTSRTADICW